MIPAIASFCSLCLAGYLILILVATRAFHRIPVHFPGSLDRFPKITVLIPARNEESRILACLQALADQDYARDHWEIIVIDDHSLDSTADLSRQFFKNHPQLQGRLIVSEGYGKKGAIETGVHQADGEWILQTDADCIPQAAWIRTMAAYMNPEFHLVSGPIRLTPARSRLERLQSLEMVGLVTLGAGSLYAGIPNMANGANLAYRKSTFLSMGGFASSRHIASGDDEFLVQATHRTFPGTLAFAKDPGAIVDTPPLSEWRSFVGQRIRWVSKARGYIQRSTNVIQLISYLGFWAFPMWLIAGIMDPFWLWTLPGLMCLKTLIDYRLMKAGTQFLQKPEWLKWLWLLEIAYIPYVIWIGIRGNMTRSYVWKGREQS